MTNTHKSKRMTHEELNSQAKGKKLGFQISYWIRPPKYHPKLIYSSIEHSQKELLYFSTSKFVNLKSQVKPLHERFYLTPKPSKGTIDFSSPIHSSTKRDRLQDVPMLNH